MLVDEAHHARALSWTRLLERFHRSRIVLLTATPFRLDGRRLPGRLVYYYPVGKALDAGIYREIVYHPVTAAKNATDEALCEKACELLEHERKTAPDIRLLVRTASVAQAPSLVALYGARGLRVREVHYRKSGSANDQTVRDLRAGHLDGVVCVGMLGEGLDIPELKIAALHSPPKSFPFTLQLIVRLSAGPSTHGQFSRGAYPLQECGLRQPLSHRPDRWRVHRRRREPGSGVGRDRRHRDRERTPV